VNFANYSAFFSFVQGLGIDIEYPAPQRGPSRERHANPNVNKPEEAFVAIRWISGGVTGGNCWGRNAEISIGPEPEPEFEDLDTIIEAITPPVSFRKYKSVCSEATEHESDTTKEFYGNCTHYAIKRVDLRRLYECLIQKRCINDIAKD
jgi:hypothetical protein